MDDSGATPDWAELRFTGSESIPVHDLFLADSLFEFKPDELFDVSRLGTAALPGVPLLVLLDDTLDSGANPNHAPFSVNADGDSIFLIRRLPSGVTELVDAVKVPALPADTAFARLGAGGPFVIMHPTPLAPNAPPGGEVHIVPAAAGGKDAVFVFPGTGSVEASSTLQRWTTVLRAAAPTGIERTWREPLKTKRYFRIR
jgi:hypothetical protein